MKCCIVRLRRSFGTLAVLLAVETLSGCGNGGADAEEGVNALTSTAGSGGGGETATSGGVPTSGGGVASGLAGVSSVGPSGVAGSIGGAGNVSVATAGTAGDPLGLGGASAGDSSLGAAGAAAVDVAMATGGAGGSVAGVAGSSAAGVAAGASAGGAAGALGSTETGGGSNDVTGGGGSTEAGDATAIGGSMSLDDSTAEGGSAGEGAFAGEGGSVAEGGSGADDSVTSAGGSAEVDGNGGEGNTAATCPSVTPLTGGMEYCSNGRASIGGGYAYELWADGGGSGCMTVRGSDATFGASWSNVEDFLARVGLDFDQTRTHSQVGTISAEFAETKTDDGGLTYIGIYGWTVNPLREFYILDDWGREKPGGFSSDGTPRDEVGTLDADGETYDVWKKTRENKPSIEGTRTFDQYFSIRRTARQCGRISVSEHFAAWEAQGLELGNLYEVKWLMEAQGNSGSIEFTTATVVVE